MLGQLRYCSFDTIIFDEINNFHKIKICPRNTNEILNRKYKTNTLIQKHNIKMEERTTFIIPVRIDSHQRELNLDFLLERLSSIENINIFICEADLEPLYKVKKEYDNVSYFFYQDPSPVFHRTKYLNIMIKKSMNEIVAIWDTDAFVLNSQINKAINEIRIGNAVMSFPYDGHFYMLSPEDSNACIQTGSFDFLHDKLDQLFLPHGPHSVGGAFIINKHMYLEAGGENENFYGWGPEDVERVMRMEILGLPITYTKGPLFHLYHPRMKNSKFTNDKLEIRNRSEYLKICSMDQSELCQYIQSWSWL